MDFLLMLDDFIAPRQKLIVPLIVPHDVHDPADKAHVVAGIALVVVDPVEGSVGQLVTFAIGQ